MNRWKQTSIGAIAPMMHWKQTTIGNAVGCPPRLAARLVRRSVLFGRANAAGDRMAYRWSR
jgi:hypothetical protein